MSAVRPAAVAGTFYPDAPGVLSAQVRAFLEEVPHALKPARQPKALIVPHAGYVYSGPIAAAAYARLAEGIERVRRVVLLGPAHRVPVRGLAVPTVDAFTSSVRPGPEFSLPANVALSVVSNAGFVISEPCWRMISRSPLCPVTYVQTHCKKTLKRRLDVARNCRCTAAQVSQAPIPLTWTFPLWSTAKPLPTTAMLPLSK